MKRSNPLLGEPCISLVFDMAGKGHDWCTLAMEDDDLRGLPSKGNPLTTNDDLDVRDDESVEDAEECLD